MSDLHYLSLGEDDKKFLLDIRVDGDDHWAAATVRMMNVRLTEDDVMQCRCGEVITRFYFNGQPSNQWFHTGQHSKDGSMGRCKDGSVNSGKRRQKQ
ncbi:MAG TPA: hypothetical protein VOA88_05965 [Candidatus Dormibacteraeota bacterium]|nr:hypothetical protein [Candidatus Dormibacteraeota bacterium]